MKRIFKLLCLLLLVAVSPSLCRAQDTLALTLEDALEIAQSSSLTVRIADKEITRTGYEKKGTYSQLFPQIDFSGSYQRTIKKQIMKMSGQSIAVGSDNTYNFGFSAAMPLINVALWKNLDISAKSVELAVEQARQSRQDLINQVELAFYAALLASDSYDVYVDNYNNAKDNYEQTKQQYEAGSVAKYDMIRAEVNMQNAEPNVYDAANALVLALWQLKALMGIDLNTEIRCVGSLEDYTDRLNELVSFAEEDIDNNAELKQIEIQSDILEDTYKAQIAQYYPSLSASFSYTWMALENDYKFKNYQWNPYSAAGLSLTIPIFSGGQRSSAVKSIKIQQEELDLQRENARRNLLVAVKQNLNSMETAVKQYNAARSTVDGAQTGYDIAKKKYEVGSGTVLDMSDAQLALLQAKLNLNNSIYSYLTAKSNLDLALGVNARDFEEYTEESKPAAYDKVVRLDEDTNDNVE